MAAADPSTEYGVVVVARFLEQAAVAQKVLEHEPTYSTGDEARAVRGEPREAAKTLVLHDHGGWRIGVLPANHRLDVERARPLVAGTRHLRLASEDEIAATFPAFDGGALPPIGPMLPLPEVVAIRIPYRDRILCPGRGRRHAIRLDPRDLIRLSEPRVETSASRRAGRTARTSSTCPIPEPPRRLRNAVTTARSMRLLIEGRPGSGKTTAATRLARLLRERAIEARGFVSHELRAARALASGSR